MFVMEAGATYTVHAVILIFSARFLLRSEYGRAGNVALMDVMFLIYCGIYIKWLTEDYKEFTLSLSSVHSFKWLF